MRKFRINRYGFFDHIFDVEMKVWYGWTLIKRFRSESSDPSEIEYAKSLAEELLEKLEEEALEKLEEEVLVKLEEEV